MTFQRLLIGIDGSFQFTASGQRVSAIVVVGSAVALGEALSGTRIIACFIQRNALPLDVLETLGRFSGAMALKQVLALLIGTLEEIPEFERVTVLRHQHQQRQAQQPAATTGTGGQQQQWQQQPVTLIGPAVELHSLALTAKLSRAIQQTQFVEVVIGQAQLTVMPAQIFCEIVEAGTVQTRQQNAALSILEEAAFFLCHRCALSRTDPEHQQLRRMATHGLTNSLAFSVAQRRADPQQTSQPQVTLLEKVEGLAHSQVGALSSFGHDRGAGRIQQILAGSQVVGQRHQRMRATYINDDRCLRIAPRLQQVQQLAPCLLQT